jgi:hypothetical protein
MLLKVSNPLEDLGGLLGRPLRFCSSVSQLQEEELQDYVMWKALGGALFFFSLYYLSTIPSSLGQTLGVLSEILDKLAPYLAAYDIHASEIFQGKAITALFLHLGFMVYFFFRLLSGALGLLLMAGIVTLWKGMHFRQALVILSYAHWFLVIALVAHGPLGLLFAQFLGLLFVARVLVERDAQRGFWKTLGTLLSLASVFVITSLYGMALS